ncbi:hypothetical protein CALVIDRAFT_569594, partial [Calocera viscosa TUFC12733]
ADAQQPLDSGDDEEEDDTGEPEKVERVPQAPKYDDVPLDSDDDEEHSEVDEEREPESEEKEATPQVEQPIFAAGMDHDFQGGVSHSTLGPYKHPPALKHSHHETPPAALTTSSPPPSSSRMPMPGQTTEEWKAELAAEVADWIGPQMYEPYSIIRGWPKGYDHQTVSFEDAMSLVKRDPVDKRVYYCPQGTQQGDFERLLVELGIIKRYGPDCCSSCYGARWFERPDKIQHACGPIIKIRVTVDNTPCEVLSCQPCIDKGLVCSRMTERIGERRTRPITSQRYSMEFAVQRFALQRSFPWRPALDSGSMEQQPLEGTDPIERERHSAALLEHYMDRMESGLENLRRDEAQVKQAAQDIFHEIKMNEI